MKILIVKTSSLGDIIQTFPALDYLRSRFPEAQIDWVVENAFSELVRAHPQVNRVLSIESRKWRKNPFKKESRLQRHAFLDLLRSVDYDLLFDFQGNLKSGLVVYKAVAAKKVGFGWRSVSEWPNALFTSYKINPASGKNVRDEYLSLVKGFFKDDSAYAYTPIPLKLEPLQQQKLVSLFSENPKPTLVCPSSAWPNKCLSEKMLIKILRTLDRGPYWFIWGSPQERESALQLSSYFSGSAVLERLSLPLLQHVMGRCQLVVAMDSLPLHLCGTTKTPSLSFFGPSSALKYAPIGEQHQAVQGECPYGELFDRRCPKLRTCATGLCLKADAIERRANDKILSNKQVDPSRLF